MINSAYLSSLKYLVIYDKADIFLSGKWLFIISNYLYNKYILYLKQQQHVNGWAKMLYSNSQNHLYKLIYNLCLHTHHLKVKYFWKAFYT